MSQEHGSCHCGKVQFDVEIDLENPVITCNCSICKRSGTMLAFVPEAQFTLRSGEDALTDYQFGQKVIHHLFCSTCGIRAFARGKGRDGSPMVAVNTRSLEGVDITTLKTIQYDGASR